MNYLVKYVQKNMFHATNSFQPQRLPQKKEIENGYTLLNDIEYDKEYPNSFLDIYLCNKVAKATIIFIHGGGYTWGDKSGGDPNAVHENLKGYFLQFLDHDYDIVSINYALAPEYQYPVPVIQISKSVKFLVNNADKYGITAQSLVFCGGSAGGQLVGQFVNIQLNQALSQKMNISPVLKKEQIKAVIFNSTLFDCARFKYVDSFLYRVLFNKCGIAYFGKKYQKKDIMNEVNVIKNITDDYPPVYVSDGNKATFTEQAREFSTRATELEIYHKINLYDKSIAVLPHGYETGDTIQASENVQIEISFLDEILNR